MNEKARRISTVCHNCLMVNGIATNKDLQTGDIYRDKCAFCERTSNLLIVDDQKTKLEYFIFEFQDYKQVVSKIIIRKDNKKQMETVKRWNAYTERILKQLHKENTKCVIINAREVQK